MTGEQLMALAIRMTEEWKDDPNVIGVGFGGKERKGQWVAGPALIFTVRKKLNTEKEILSAKSRPIPDKIEGILTDVIVVDDMVPSFWSGDRGTHIEEPLKGGVSTASLVGFLPFPTNGGTLGSVCYYNDGRLMAISNAHVWGDGLGKDIVQPVSPTSKFIEAGIVLLACGHLTLFIAEDLSGLTGVLTSAAGIAWMAFAAADFKDPHRRGQEATLPNHLNEKTEVESVQFSAEPQTLPLPGTLACTSVDWRYTRQTDQDSYPFAVSETRTNEHVLVRNHVWAEEPIYHRGQTVRIKALVETARSHRPDAFHTVVHLVPDNQPNKCITRVLHPTKCQYVPFLCVNFLQPSPNSHAKFPIHQQGIIFRANRPGYFRDWWPREEPDGQVELQFPGEGLEMELTGSPAERADVYVVQFDPEPIILEAYDTHGNLIDKAATSGTVGMRHKLSVRARYRNPEIRKLFLQGAQGEGLLLLACFKTGNDYPQPIHPSNQTFCYHGKYKLAPDDPLGPWKALVSVQTCNTVPPDTPPEQAAETIGGIENAVLAKVDAECVVSLAFDHLFEVE